MDKKFNVTYTFGTGFNKNKNKLTFKQGEKYFLIGQNGIGKTTLLNALQNMYDKEIYLISYSEHLTKELLAKWIERFQVSEQLKALIVDKWEEKTINLFYGKKSINTEFEYIESLVNDFYKDKYEEQIKSFYKKKKAIIEKLKLNNDQLIKEIPFWNKKTINILLSMSDLIDYNLHEINSAYEGVHVYDYMIEDLKYSNQHIEESIKSCLTNLSLITENRFGQVVSNIKRLNVQFGNRNITSVFDSFNMEDWEEVVCNNEKVIKLKEEHELLINKLNLETENIVKQTKNLSWFDVAYFQHYITFSFNASINASEYNPNAIIHNEEVLKKYEIDYGIDEYGRMHVGNGVKFFCWIQNQLEQLNASESTSFVIDEPFSYMDEGLSKKFINFLNNDLSNTFLLSTHEYSIIEPSMLENVIVMYWDKNKERCLGSLMEVYEELVEVDDVVLKTLNNSLYNWIENNINKKILLVEGGWDFKILKKFLPSDINVIPYNGTLHFQKMFASIQKTANIKVLHDKDASGKELFNLIPANMNVTNVVFDGTPYKILEEVFSNGKVEFNDKRKTRNNVEKGLYNKKVVEICEKISEAY